MKKKYALKVTKTYSPIIAIMGKAQNHHTDYMPKLVSSIASNPQNSNISINTKGYPRTLKRRDKSGKKRLGEDYEY